MRPLERGDLIICEIHPKYGGYFTHVERTFSLGEPPIEYRKIYEGCLAAYETGLEFFRPGRKITEAMNAVRDAITARGLGMCKTGIHGHDLGRPLQATAMLLPRADHSLLTTSVATYSPASILLSDRGYGLSSINSILYCRYLPSFGNCGLL